MTKDFFLGQLRILLIALAAYATGKGWLSAADQTLIGAILPPIGFVFGPWIWSIYRNINSKIVPADSIAVREIVPGDQPLTDSTQKGDHLNVGGTVAKVVGCLIAALMLSALLSPAFAQDRPRLILNPPVSLKSDDAAGDLMRALDAKLLPDLKYALNLARAAKSDITANCYAAWIDMIEARAAANTDDPPNPAVITNFERAVEMRNALQPDSKFMIACSPVANMVKKDIAGFIGKVVTGGISAGMLIPGL